MPLYEYECQKCHQRLETLQRVSEPPLTICPECAGELRKLVSAPAFHLKGEGWYVTDYARKAESRGAKAEDQAGEKAEKAEKAAEAGKAEGKPEGKDAAAKDAAKAETPKEPKAASKAAGSPAS